MSSKVSETLHVSNYLANFADDSLDVNARYKLVQIIEQLFIDLKDGHSCSILKQISKILKLKENDILDVLRQSSLANFYETCPQTLNARPISILQVQKDTLLYISKYLQYELDVVLQILKAQVSYEVSDTDAFLELERLQKTSGLPNIEQLSAIKVSHRQKLSIITGGPGTGKTTTVTLLLWLFCQIYGNSQKIRVCAPTGKAAIRVKQSIENSILDLEKNGLSIDRLFFDELLGKSGNFSTIHKLLGYRDKSIYFKHNKISPVDVDILIIDESSMIGLALFSKLLQALDMTKIKHIILLGDKNQLSSVDEGYVFASLVCVGSKSNPQKVDLFNQDVDNLFVSELTASKRNLGDVGIVANAILHNDINTLYNTINKSKMVSIQEVNKIESDLNIKKYAEAIRNFDKSSMDVNALFKLYNKSATLCLTNVGKYGTEAINIQIEKKIKRLNQISDDWYDGRVIIILENDYNLGLYNGDIGICLIIDEVAKVFFADGNAFKELIPEVLPKYTRAYAITVHKSQGSEYEHVNLVLCENSALNLFNGILSKELVYTGVTRAKKSVNIYAGDKVLVKAMNNQTVRNTGLDFMLVNQSCISH